MTKRPLILLALLLLVLLAATACGVERRGDDFKLSVLTDAGMGEGEGEGEPELVCPDRENPTGVRVGSPFPSTRFPNADWEPVSIKDLCGSKAILVVSATEWCGACIAELNYLALVAADWRERGGEVYYTLFEDGGGQPAGRGTLRRFEEYLLDKTVDFGDRDAPGGANAIKKGPGGFGFVIGLTAISSSQCF